MGRVLPFIVCVLGAPAVSATVLVPAEFREIVAGAEIIAHARIIGTRAEWADGRREINTIVTAQVLSVYKGDAARTVVFKVPGGLIGRYRNVLVGAPVFRTGDEAVLFLTQGTSDLPFVFGLNQGVFRIRQDSRSGQRIVVPPPLMAAGDAPERVVRGTAARRPMELNAFGAQVRAVIAAQKGGER